MALCNTCSRRSVFGLHVRPQLPTHLSKTFKKTRCATPLLPPFPNNKNDLITLLPIYGLQTLPAWRPPRSFQIKLGFKVFCEHKFKSNIVILFCSTTVRLSDFILSTATNTPRNSFIDGAQGWLFHFCVINFN